MLLGHRRTWQSLWSMQDPVIARWHSTCLGQLIGLSAARLLLLCPGTQQPNGKSLAQLGSYSGIKGWHIAAPNLTKG